MVVETKVNGNPKHASRWIYCCELQNSHGYVNQETKQLKDWDINVWAKLDLEQP